MTADDLTRRDPALLRRAIIAAHDAEHERDGIHGQQLREAIDTAEKGRT